MKYKTYRKYKYIFEKIGDVIRTIFIDIIVMLAILVVLCGTEYLASLL